MKYFALGLVLLGFLAAGCDVITPPYTRTSTTDTTRADTGIVRYRKVLIEEFTGAQCTNCPLGHRRLAELASVFGDSVVVVSIHAGDFARPDARKGYPVDLRTAAGEELNSRFRVFAYPAAVINRTKIDGTSYVVGVQNCGTALNTQLRTTTPIAIKTRALCDTLRNELAVQVWLELMSDVPYPLNIGYYIIEDSIVAPQLDNGTYVPEYIHRHVLRDAPLGAYGAPLITAPATAGTRLERTYTYNLQQASWNRHHLEVVVFIARPEPDYTIIQCDGHHVEFGQN
jgi:thiol-disulfide isomerase/thioredoxin